MADLWEGATPLPATSVPTRDVFQSRADTIASLNMADFEKGGQRDYLSQLNLHPANEQNRTALNAIIHFENDHLNPRAISQTGDHGLFQISPTVGKEIGYTRSPNPATQLQQVETRWLPKLAQRIQSTDPGALALGNLNQFRTKQLLQQAPTKSQSSIWDGATPLPHTSDPIGAPEEPPDVGYEDVLDTTMRNVGSAIVAPLQEAGQFAADAYRRVRGRGPRREEMRTPPNTPPTVESETLHSPSPFLDPVEFLTGAGLGGAQTARTGLSLAHAAMNALRTGAAFQTYGLSEVPRMAYGLARGMRTGYRSGTRSPASAPAPSEREKALRILLAKSLQSTDTPLTSTQPTGPQVPPKRAIKPRAAASEASLASLTPTEHARGFPALNERLSAKGATAQDLITYYQDKYGISKPITLKLRTHVNPLSQVEAYVKKTKDGYLLYATPDASLTTIRHELEHIMDLERGFTASSGRYKHFQHYPDKETFASDYYRRSLIKDALRRGETIPPEVLAKYPDLVKQQSVPIQTTPLKRKR